MPSFTLLALLGAASFAAGLVDSIAGGGGLVTVPALLAAALPPHLALGTNKGQSVFGTLAAVVSYARRGYVDRSRIAIGLSLGFAGSILGALAQLAVSPSVLRPVVIAMLLVAAIVVAWPRRADARASGERPHARAAPLRHARAIGAALALVFGAYDGFFGPGVGTMLLVAFVVVYADSMTHASANAKVVNLASNFAAFATFAIRGTIVWPIAITMAVANAAGGWTGAHLAHVRGDRLVRVAVLVVVVALVAKLALDLRR